MFSSLVLTVICDDKPGVVETIAKIIATHQGNWLESRLSQLSGKFAGVIRVQVESENEDALSSQLKALEEQNINIIIDRGNNNETNVTVQGKSASFSALGPDRPGIVREISQAFATRKINVEELNTNLSSMPYSGDPLFEAQGILSIPNELDFDELREKLDDIANTLAIDFSIEESE